MAIIKDLLGPPLDASVTFVGGVTVDRRGVRDDTRPIPPAFSNGGKHAIGSIDELTAYQRDLGITVVDENFAGNAFHQSRQMARASGGRRRIAVVSAVSTRNGYADQARTRFAQNGVNFVSPVTFDGEPDQTLVIQIDTTNGPEDLLLSYKNDQTPAIPVDGDIHDIVILGSTSGSEWPTTWNATADRARSGDFMLGVQLGSKQVKEANTTRGRKALRDAIGESSIWAGNEREGVVAVRVLNPTFAPIEDADTILALGEHAKKLALISLTRGPNGAQVLVSHPERPKTLFELRSPSELIGDKRPNTIGAGDAHFGVLLEEILETGDVISALQKANYAGTLVATHESATELQPTRTLLANEPHHLPRFLPRERIIAGGLQTIFP